MYKAFEELNISNVSIFFNWLPILHIHFDGYYNFRHFNLTIITELLRERSLLRNSTLITSHLIVL